MPDERTCAHCSGSLPATARRDARYCADRCRMAARRAKATAPRPVQTAPPRPAEPALEAKATAPLKATGPWSVRNPLG